MYMPKDRLTYIADRISERDLILQIAEEASELAAAAAKVIRIMNGTNPTPVSYVEAKNNLAEELGDVELCLVLAQRKKFLSPEMMLDCICQKTNRWSDRLHDFLREDDDDE